MTGRGSERDRVGRGLLALGAGLPFLAVAIVLLWSREVTLVEGRHGAAEVQEWRRLRDPRDDPAEIYGAVAPGPPRRVLLPPWSDPTPLVPLPEAPGRLLLFVDEAPGLRLLSPWAVLVPALGAGALLAGLALLRGRRRGGAVAP